MWLCCIVNAATCACNKIEGVGRVALSCCDPSQRHTKAVQTQTPVKPSQHRQLRAPAVLLFHSHLHLRGCLQLAINLVHTVALRVERSFDVVAVACILAVPDVKVHAAGLSPGMKAMCPDTQTSGSRRRLRTLKWDGKLSL